VQGAGYYRRQSREKLVPFSRWQDDNKKNSKKAGQLESVYDDIGPTA